VNARKQTETFKGYVFHAKSVAAHFHYTRGNPDFGSEYALCFHGDANFKQKRKPVPHSDEEISFRRSFVHVFCKKERGGVYTTISKSGIKDLKVKGKLTADEIECGVMSVYREEWYSNPALPRRPRILPLPPVINNLKIGGKAFRLGKELRLPKPFSYNDEQREKYFLGEGDEIDPVGVSASSDTRRIEIPDFGIVTIADWKWIPSDIHIGDHTAQWVQLIGLELTNPGSGGGAGAGGGGTPSGA
jgi:hypothetical protein